MPLRFNTSSSPFSLSQLMGRLELSVRDAFPSTYWVVAEISKIKTPASGHTYYELVEHNETGETLAKMQTAVIWRNECDAVLAAFVSATGNAPEAGRKVLMRVRVNMNAVWGLSFHIREIDPSYTLGELMRRRQETIDRLKREGLTDRNGRLSLPPVLQRIAVVSSPSAAGYRDFAEHLAGNDFGYAFRIGFFEALMQGEDAASSIRSALQAVASSGASYDAVVIIRGGGSKLDLACFDDYGLAAAVALFPLPVLTGIGHEEDVSVTDLMAHSRFRTPTAVAGFIIDRAVDFEVRTRELAGRLEDAARDMLAASNSKLMRLAQRTRQVAGAVTQARATLLRQMMRRLERAAAAAVTAGESRLGRSSWTLSTLPRGIIRTEMNRLGAISAAVRAGDPKHLLKKGYSITLRNGKPVKDAAEVKKGEVVETVLFRGKIKSRKE